MKTNSLFLISSLAAILISGCASVDSAKINRLDENTAVWVTSSNFSGSNCENKTYSESLIYSKSLFDIETDEQVRVDLLLLDINGQETGITGLIRASGNLSDSDARILSVDSPLNDIKLARDVDYVIRTSVPPRPAPMHERTGIYLLYAVKENGGGRRTIAPISKPNSLGQPSCDRLQ